MNLRYAAALLAAGILGACRPEMPTTSTITIDLNRPTVAVDRDLYGVTSEAADGTVRPDEGIPGGVKAFGISFGY